MVIIKTCPTCGAQAKCSYLKGITTYKAIQDNEIFGKINQLNKLVKKYQDKADLLEKELQLIKESKKH